MSGQQIGTVVGGIIGAYFGNPQLGMAIGGFIGGVVDPTKINGPHLGDGQQQTATDGAPIAWVMGTATIAGTIIAVGPRREVKVTDSGGKGGPVVSHYESRQDFAILVCESSELKDSTIESILMVEQDGKIVYDMRDDSEIKWDSYKWARNVDFQFGAEDQMPHPTLEAITGVGSTPAYRGRCIAVFKDFNIYASGDRIPQFRFTVSSSTTFTPATEMPDIDMSLTAPVWAGEDQNHIVGGYKDYALDTEATNQLLVTYVQNWATYRIILVPIYGNFVPGEEGYTTDEAADVLRSGFSNNCYDTGWHADVASNILSSGWINWWPDHGMAEPDVVIGAVGNLPKKVSINGARPTGVRMYNFYYFGGHDANDNSIDLTLSDSEDHTVVAWDGTKYEAADGTILWPSWADSSDDQTGSANSIALSELCERISQRGGLESTDIDVTALVSVDVAGYPIARQCTGADALAPLLQAYFAYATQYDEKLNFAFYGYDADITVDKAHLLEGNDSNNGNITETTRNQATEFPQKIVGSYMDPDQNYMTVNVTAERRSTSIIAIGEQTFGIPVVMPGIDATRAVDRALKVAYATLEGTREYCVPFARGDTTYITACAGEAVLMDGKRWVIDQSDLCNGYLKFSTRYDRQSAYTSNVQVIEGNGPAVPTSKYSGPTTLVVMNLPSLRPQDTYGVYLAAKGGASWRGCNVQVSYDGQQSWQSAVTITLPSIIGELVEDIPSDGEPIVVDIGDDDLSSVTEDQLAANANAFAMIYGSGDADIGQFQFAEEQSDGDWSLTEVTRGLAGTTELAHEIGDTFVMLQAVYFLPIDTSFKGKTLYFRGVGFGEVAEDQAVIDLVYDPDTTIIYDGGNASTGT